MPLTPALTHYYIPTHMRCHTLTHSHTHSFTVLLIYAFNHTLIRSLVFPLVHVLQGWYLPEMAHPFFKFKGAGFHVDVCSVNGGDTTCTPASIDLSDEQNKQFYETPELIALTKGTASLSSYDSSKYDCVFFVGGFGTMW